MLFSIAAGLEKSSEHPLSGAVIAKAEELNIAPATVDDFKSFAGRGISGSIDGKPAYVGKPNFLTENGIDATEAERTILSA